MISNLDSKIEEEKLIKLYIEKKCNHLINITNLNLVNLNTPIPIYKSIISLIKKNFFQNEARENFNNEPGIYLIVEKKNTEILYRIRFLFNRSIK